ncbi:MAG: hypothetical protein KDA85_06470, partial [Planctomycetaceae bacterium]|nr:hypothetical protein [Planctomycetaceae bacterium]
SALLPAAVVGCNESGTQTVTETATTPENAPVNKTCPIMGGDVDPAVKTAWGDKTIGFCCEPCIEEWQALSDDEKTTKLAKVTE